MNNKEQELLVLKSRRSGFAGILTLLEQMFPEENDSVGRGKDLNDVVIPIK